MQINQHILEDANWYPLQRHVNELKADSRQHTSTKQIYARYAILRWHLVNASENNLFSATFVRWCYHMILTVPF